MTTKLSDEVQDLCRAFVEGLDVVLGEKLYGVYLYGAIVFPEGGATGDIDFHVILAETLDEQEKAALRGLHTKLSEDYPPLGGELDGYYILLEEARQTPPPKHQWMEGVVDGAWALHREHILAGRCKVLRGPDPRTIYPETTWVELAEALEKEKEYVEAHLRDYPAYCVLNLCRLMYSHETRDVVISKRASAAWARERYAEWQSHIDAAIRAYDHKETAKDRELLSTEVEDLFEFASERIRETEG
jgi:predicted nucleotidyltransferase